MRAKIYVDGPGLASDPLSKTSELCKVLTDYYGIDCCPSIQSNRVIVVGGLSIAKAEDFLELVFDDDYSKYFEIQKCLDKTELEFEKITFEYEN